MPNENEAAKETSKAPEKKTTRRTPAKATAKPPVETEEKTAEKKTESRPVLPMLPMPPMPAALKMPAPAWNVNQDAQKKQWNEFKSYVETFWDQMEEFHRNMVETWKKQWEMAFSQLMEMEDTFASFLPEELPGMPDSPLSPKNVRGKVKEIQEIANKHAVEQNENFVGFVKEGQKQAKKAVQNAVKSIEKKAAEKSAD